MPFLVTHSAPLDAFRFWGWAVILYPFLALLFALTHVSVVFAQAPGASRAQISLSAEIMEQIDRNEWVDVLILLDASDRASERASSLESGPLSALRGPAYDIMMEQRRHTLDTLKDRTLQHLAEPGNLETINRYSVLPVLHARIRSRSQLERLVRDPAVLSVDEVLETYPMLAESLPLIQQPIAEWAGYTGAGTSVCVLDTGVDYTRDAFGNCTTVKGQPSGSNCKVAYVRDFAPEDGLLDDSSLHGTHVSAIVVGTAPETRIIGLDVFGGKSASTTDIIAAIDWCIAHRATYDIAAINMSLGTSRVYAIPIPSTDAWGSSIAHAVDAGIAVVAASGNGAQSTGISLPAAYDQVISVGAVYDAHLGSMSWSSCSDSLTWADKVSCFSNSAYFLTLLAPGALVTATEITKSGTSMASPFAAGALAILRQVEPDATVADLTQRLLDSDTQITDPRNNVTTPRLDLQRATSMALDQQHRLIVQRSGSGSGIVTSEPTGIECGTICSASYSESTSVTLTAQPAEGSIFTEWLEACSGSGPCTVGMTQERNVTAAFEKKSTALSNGQTLDDLSGASDSFRHFHIDVPSGATNLVVRAWGDNGDVDLYLRHGSEPSLEDWDCRSNLDGNDESCSESSPLAGRYHVLLHGYTDYTGVSLQASYDIPDCPYPEHITLANQTVSDPTTYNACDTLTAGPSVTVSAGGNLHLRAGKRITLRPGFRVVLGGIARVEIDPIMYP